MSTLTSSSLQLTFLSPTTPPSLPSFIKQIMSDSQATQRRARNPQSGPPTKEFEKHAKQSQKEASNPEAGEFNVGDRVLYHPVGGGHGTNTSVTTGVIKEIITHDAPVGTGSTKRSTPTVHASDKEPRYVIENDHTHKETAYKSFNIERKLEEGDEHPKVEIELGKGVEDDERGE
ncbi:hypothetical protein BKA69DRAFT_1123189 [Paraphysoderma sedebokerense]|nr:hypothetical protein BKA69DRAFT_1123189 [Paraphysoderma sedebokerense]